MQAAQKKQAILRLLAVGGPVLLTLMLFVLTASRFGYLSKHAEPVASAEVTDASALPQEPTSPSVPLPSRIVPGRVVQSVVPSIMPSAPMVAKPVQQGPLLAPARGVTTRPVSSGYVGTQPLSEALEAMVEQEANDPLDDDLFLNTTSLEKLNEQLIPEVRAGFSLGKSGAVYAAREQFIYVLRRVAVAKDAKEQSDRHMKALAKGLRALDEADDFTPKGDSIEAELDTLAISASHATPLLHREGVVYDEITPEILTPHQASAEYARYAAQQLSEAMSEEEAGSMALYGLGKTFARLEAQSKEASAGLKCNVMYRAAAIAHPENYLAANELGVRLAKAGRYESARKVLQLAARQPANATVFENLAAVELKLGNVAQAEQIQRTSHQIALRERMQSEVSRRHGVAWVSPDEFRSSGPSHAANAQPVSQQGQVVASQPHARQQTSSSGIQRVSQANPNRTEPSQSGWRTAFNYVKKATGWERSSSNGATISTPIDSRSDNQLARRPASPQLAPSNGQQPSMRPEYVQRPTQQPSSVLY